MMPLNDKPCRQGGLLIKVRAYVNDDIHGPFAAHAMGMDVDLVLRSRLLGDPFILWWRDETGFS
jgi:hypothetical protein